MSALVALQWPKNDAAVREYLARVPSRLYTLDAPQRFERVPGAVETAALVSILDDEARERIALEARERAARCEAVAARCAGSAGSAYSRDLAGRLEDIALLAAALDAVHERDGVDLVLLNEDSTHRAKTAALWAQAHGVPVVVISHSCITGRLYTVHGDVHADATAVFGTRGAVAYTERGITPEHLAVTGNPAWDDYAPLLPRKTEYRAAFRARHGLAPDAFVVLFATTWSAYLSGFDDPSFYERSLRDFLRAGRALRAAGMPVALVVKERPSNAALASRIPAIAQEEGVGDVLVYEHGLPELILASDATVSVNSNVAIESGICDVPAVNLWYPLGWYNGAMYDALDGVLEAAPDKLANALGAVLADQPLRALLAQQRAAWVPRAAANIGRAASATAELMAQRRKPRGKSRRYVWHELSSPRNAFEKGSTAEYYNNPREELVRMLRHTPRTVFDVGCGGGATGALLKRLYPNVHVTGAELSAEAAEIAESRVDRVLRQNVEAMDFSEVGFAEGSIDVLLLPDVLEHLYDPWRLLDRLKPYLSSDAQVLASIPNVRNLWLINELLRGSWPYAEEGLLDITHIRFFTRRSVAELFEQTGYRIERWGANFDPRVPVMQAPEGQAVDIDTQLLAIRKLADVDLQELRTLQFLVDAVKA